MRIYFDTPTFDRIVKDRAAKFVDMLSAIGGTMGLLTGFSIISAVGIIYFAAKILCKILSKEKKNCTDHRQSSHTIKLAKFQSALYVVMG